ncbi:hypothetical protein CsSME_00002712 [Camellia sinensis var. sinensis]
MFYYCIISFFHHVMSANTNHFLFSIGRGKDKPKQKDMERQAQENLTFPPNYQFWFEVVKLITKAMLIILGCGNTINFPQQSSVVVMRGLDAAGKTTILYKLHIGELLSTVPTIDHFHHEGQKENISRK